MANEITMTSQLRVAKTSVSLSESKQLSKTFDMSGDDFGKVTQSIGTSTHVALTIPTSIGTANVGAFYALNTGTSTANYIMLGSDSGGTFVPFLRIYGGRHAVGQYEPAQPYAKASGATQSLEHGVFEA